LSNGSNGEPNRRNLARYRYSYHYSELRLYPWSEVTAKWGTLDVTARRRRYIAVVIVGAVHILILEVFIHSRDTGRGSEEDTTVWSTLFLVPAEVVQQPPPAKVKAKTPEATRPPALPEPTPDSVSSITTTPSVPSSAPQSGVDWMSALQGTAADIIKDEARPELVIWVSDRCYMVSEPPAAGTPNAFAHLALTHTQCAGSPGPRTDLFEDFPQYKKLHPAE
jgi:hypothetical protein